MNIISARPLMRLAGAVVMLLLITCATLHSEAPKKEEPKEPPQQGEYDAERKLFDGNTGNSAPYVRSYFFDRLARTRDKKALALLYDRYTTPTKDEDWWKDHVRYLIAGECGEYFAAPEFVETLTQLADRHAADEHAWLWYNTLLVQAKHKGTDGVAAVAKDDKKPLFVRAAALEALAKAKAPEIAATVAVVLGGDDKVKPAIKPPATAFARAMLAMSCAAAVAAAGDVASDDGKRAVRMVIDQLNEKLDDKGNGDRFKLVIARYLGCLFNKTEMYINAESWRAVLDGAAASKGNTRARPSFIGLEGSGTRFVYVIDLSDSMLEPLKVEEKEDLKRAITGPGSKSEEEKEQDKKNAKKKKEESFGPETLPWDKINNRFEAAREFLRASLKMLAASSTKEAPLSFTVVTFGTKAELLKGLNGIVEATNANVDNACKALDAIPVGAKTAANKYGTLKGNTNLHGGLLLGYQVTGGASLKRLEHIDPKSFETGGGGDTLFILSDGVPSWDDFNAEGKRLPWVIPGNPESRVTSNLTENVRYYGPYVDLRFPFLVRDVQRLNMFRKCEIHCVAIGEADPVLLETIAGIGMGKVRRIASGAK